MFQVNFEWMLCVLIALSVAPVLVVTENYKHETNESPENITGNLGLNIPDRKSMVPESLDEELKETVQGIALNLTSMLR